MQRPNRNQERWRCLRQIHADEPPSGGGSRRVLGTVQQVVWKGKDFVEGRVRVGRDSCVRFNNYSFNNGMSGFHLGPMHVRPHYDPLMRNNISKKMGNAPGTAIYGVVVNEGRGVCRFDSALISPQLATFIDAMHRGLHYVHDNRERLYFPDGRGDLYAGACLIMGDVHTLMYECLVATARPQDYRPLNLDLDPVHFVIVMACFTESSHMFQRFSRLLQARASSVEPKYLAMLKVYLEDVGREVKLTGECIALFSKNKREEEEERRRIRTRTLPNQDHQEKGAGKGKEADRGEGREKEEDAESVGSLEEEDDEEEGEEGEKGEEEGKEEGEWTAMETTKGAEERDWTFKETAEGNEASKFELGFRPTSGPEQVGRQFAPPPLFRHEPGEWDSPPFLSPSSPEHKVALTFGARGPEPVETERSVRWPAEPESTILPTSTGSVSAGSEFVANNDDEESEGSDFSE